MLITAKYPSTCPVCSASIAAGDKVEWTKGEKARHASCASGDAPAAPAPAAQTRNITVERVGRRSYLRGDTLSVRGLLRDGGCHWDADAKAWWIGSQETAMELVARGVAAPAEAAPKKRVTHCVGCGGHLDSYQVQRGFRFCSSDCSHDMRMGGQSGYVNGSWHQGSND